MKTIECCGTPREMGRQYGEGARDDIQYEVENLGQYFVTPRLEAFYAEADRILEKYLPDIREEILGIAEGANVDKKILLVILLIRHLILSEWHISYCHIKEIVRIIRLFKSCDFNVGIRI